MRIVRKAVLFLVLVICSSAVAEYKTTFLFKDRKSIVRPNKGEITGFRSDISRKSLLKLERMEVGGMPLYKASQAGVDTIRVLALRLKFQKEDPDNALTTGDGNFDLRSQQDFLEAEGHLTDPSPHDSSYFNAHFRALNQYWGRVSGNRLVILPDIYPKDETLSYTLPESMSYYGCVGSSQDSLYRMLSRLFYDSFKLADSLSQNDPDISKYKFGNDYDAFMIFHAGADRQNDFYGDSPCDLMTGFLLLEDTIWVHLQGGDSTIVTEGMIMPETVSQDEWVSGLGVYWATAMNAVFTHQFGYQLGLPDFYNTHTFMTQIGDFSLMDNNGLDIAVPFEDGSGHAWWVSGAMPIYPDAWCRAYLGFIQPKTMDVDSIGNLGILACELVSDTFQAVKVPINSEEYFLLENRRTDLDGSDSIGLKLDGLTNVILYPIDARVGVDTFNGEYDYFIPGSGMLIWHIDEGVAYLDYDGNGQNNFENNQLQWDKDRRFINVVEADGIIDFGGDYYTGYGLQEDMFYLGNNNSFTPYTFPRSYSNSKANSHIFITNISRAGTWMDCDVFYSWFQSGWKQKVFPEQSISSLVYADVDADDSMEIFLSSANKIYGWRNNGNKIIDNDSVFLQTNLNEHKDTLPLAIFGVTDSTIFGPPSLGDLNGDDTLEIVAGDLSGKVYTWSCKDIYGGDGLADSLTGFPVELGSPISCVPVISDFNIANPGLEIFAGTDSGKWYYISSDGVKIDSSDLGEKIVGLATTDVPGMNFVVTEGNDSAHLCNTAGGRVLINNSTINSIPVAGDLNRDSTWEVIIVGGDGKLYVWDSNLNLLSGFPVNLNQTVKASPVLGDVDEDGYLEIVLVGDNKLLAYNYNGTLATEFPLIADRGKDIGLIESSPVLADINGDDLVDIIFGTPDREIMAFDGKGKKIEDFPLSCGAEVNSSGIILDLDQDQNLELLAVALDGFVYAWDLSSTSNHNKVIWSMYGYDNQHTNSFPLSELPSSPTIGELLPRNLFYNYPNPAKDETYIRYFLSHDADVEIKIYDLAGDLIFRTLQSGLGQTDNEYHWDCSKYASGVYVCRVEAKTISQKVVAFCKIALVK